MHSVAGTGWQEQDVPRTCHDANDLISFDSCVASPGPVHIEYAGGIADENAWLSAQEFLAPFHY